MTKTVEEMQKRELATMDQIGHAIVAMLNTQNIAPRYVLDRVEWAQVGCTREQFDEWYKHYLHEKMIRTQKENERKRFEAHRKEIIDELTLYPLVAYEIEKVVSPEIIAKWKSVLQADIESSLQPVTTASFWGEPDDS